MLHIAPDVEVPVDLLVESTGVLAKKGAGKTSFGVVLAEEAHAAGVPAVIIDPKGDWWGIRAGADGDPAGGLPFPVFGGLHGDIPLQPENGAYIADLVRSENMSVLLDVSEFDSDAARRRFLIAFADRLYRFDSHEPMVLILEEAHEYIPQAVSSEDAKLVNVFARIVKQGRHKGLGVVMLTQRSASLNKNVLTQIDNLVVLQTTAPQDRDVVKSWVQGHGDASEILAGLPSMKPGEFWLWQPGRGEPVHARARMRHTYDSGATPKIGEAARPVATLADINLGAIETAMSDAIEKAKADDPRELRKQITNLTAQVAHLEAAVAIIPEPERVEVSVLTDEDRALLREHATLLRDGVLGLMRTAVADIDRTADKLAGAAASVPPNPAPARARVELPRPQVVHRARVESVQLVADPLPGYEFAVAEKSVESLSDLTPSQRSILTVLAQFPRPLSSKQIMARGGPSWKSSSFKSALPVLRRAGLLADGGNDALTITDSGRALIGPVDAPPIGRELLTWWGTRLKPTEHRILSALVAVWPAALSAGELSEQTGYSGLSSSFKSAIPALKNQELIYGTNDALHAADDFGD